MSEKVLVLFDTSALRELSPRSAASRQLLSLVKHQRVEVHVPPIVRRELESQLRQIAAPIGDRIEAASWLSAATYDKVKPLLGGPTLATMSLEILQTLEQWLKDLEAVEGDFAPAQEVFDLYFRGDPPFGSAKQRKDLPDAFVFAAVRTLAQSRSETVHFICADSRLRRACQSIPGVVVHESIHALLALRSLRALNEVVSKGDIERYEKQIFEMIADEVGDLLFGDEVSRQDSEVGEGWVRTTGPVVKFGLDAKDYWPLSFDDESLEVPFYCVVSVGLVDTPELVAASSPQERAAFVHVEGWANVTWRSRGAHSVEPASATVQVLHQVFVADRDD